MSTSLLIIIGVIVIGGALIFWVWINSQSKDQTARFELGEPANATIIEVGTSRLGKYGEPFSAALRLLVTPRAGEPYKVRSPWIVEFEHVAEIRVGASLPVRIDKLKKNVIHPDVAWAKYDWQREHEPEPVYEDTHPIGMR